MEKKYGFTLAEVLITLVILGVVIALTVPSILNKKPNENMAKFKKAYATVEKVVTEMANDEQMYPDDGNPSSNDGIDLEGNLCANSNSAGACHKAVFMNTSAYRGFAGNTKFCGIFASMVNTVGQIRCNGTDTAFANGAVNAAPSFSTTDGVDWYITQDAVVRTRNNGNARNNAIEIQVDVNSGSRASTDTRAGNNPDRFRFWIDFDGKIIVPTGDLVATQYLRQTSPSYKYRP